MVQLTVIIGSAGDFVPVWHQAITLINRDLVCRCIYAPLGPNELTYGVQMVHFKTSDIPVQMTDIYTICPA